jgi:hypothetical protein
MRIRSCTSATYLAAHRHAYSWAEKALRYRRSGKFARAKAAVEKVEQWLQKIVALERLARPQVRGND